MGNAEGWSLIKSNRYQVYHSTSTLPSLLWPLYLHHHHHQVPLGSDVGSYEFRSVGPSAFIAIFSELADFVLIFCMTLGLINTEKWHIPFFRKVVVMPE